MALESGVCVGAGMLVGVWVGAIVGIAVEVVVGVGKMREIEVHAIDTATSRMNIKIGGLTCLRWESILPTN